MNVKQSYFDFLTKQGAKEKVKAIIEHDIREWKEAQAYRYNPEDNDPGDRSGHCWSISGKTIGDIAKTDREVLLAYTGDSEATYTSGCGLNWLRVADRISENINDCLSELKSKFIKENTEALFEEYDIEHDDSWTWPDTFFAIDEAMIFDFDSALHDEWMQQQFPEYADFEFEEWHIDYAFNIKD